MRTHITGKLLLIIILIAAATTYAEVKVYVGSDLHDPAPFAENPKVKIKWSSSKDVGEAIESMTPEKIEKSKETLSKMMAFYCQRKAETFRVMLSVHLVQDSRQWLAEQDSKPANGSLRKAVDESADDLMRRCGWMLK